MIDKTAIFGGQREENFDYHPELTFEGQIDNISQPCSPTAT
jgi:hypothetical protein